MPKLTLDATDVQDFGPIPDGVYEGKVHSVEDVEKGPKAHYIPVVYEITAGDHKGRRFWNNYTIEGPGLGFFIRDVNRLLGEGTLEAGEVTEFDTDDLIDAECELVIEEDEYQGEIRSKVSKILPV